MLGFNTDQVVGKHYQVVAKNENNRAWPESVLPASAPAGAVPPAAPARPPAPPPPPSGMLSGMLSELFPPPPPPARKPEPAADSRWQWYDGSAWVVGGPADFREWAHEHRVVADTVYMIPFGSTEPAKLASEHGFEVIPF
jgi:hypothetical protein